MPNNPSLIVLLIALFAAPVTVFAAQKYDAPASRIDMRLAEATSVAADISGAQNLDDDTDETRDNAINRVEKQKGNKAEEKIRLDKDRQVRDQARDGRHRARKMARDERHEDRDAKRGAHRQEMDDFHKRMAEAATAEERQAITKEMKAARMQSESDYAKRPKAVETDNLDPATGKQMQATQTKLPPEPQAEQEVERVKEQSAKKPWWKFWDD